MMRFTGILAGVCIIAALVLGALYNTTKPIIAEQKTKAIQQALQRVIPGADTYEKKAFSEGEYFECFQNKEFIGYALFITGAGYSGDIKMLLGINKEGTVLGLEVLAQAETPGLGAKCIEIKRGQNQPWFLEQFYGKNIQKLAIQNINTLTGATITSEAILESVKTSAGHFLHEVNRNI
jgi:Na+-translocating ferredoxin:NAD+ oxidoreductase subunit G